jgi:hypothetical protein
LLGEAKMGCVMDVRESPRQRVLGSAKRLLTKLSGLKFVFTLSSSGYCAIHWLVMHSFSIYVFSGALVFGALATTAAACLAAWLSPSSST